MVDISNWCKVTCQFPLINEGDRKDGLLVLKPLQLRGDKQISTGPLKQT